MHPITDTLPRDLLRQSAADASLPSTSAQMTHPRFHLQPLTRMPAVGNSLPCRVGQHIVSQPSRTRWRGSITVLERTPSGPGSPPVRSLVRLADEV